MHETFRMLAAQRMAELDSEANNHHLAAGIRGQHRFRARARIHWSRIGVVPDARRSFRMGMITFIAAMISIAVINGSAGAAPKQKPFLGICQFPIVHEFPKVNSVRAHGLPEVAPYDGFLTGQFIVEVINVDSGESVVLDANSPFFDGGDGTGVVRGHTVWFLDEQKGDVPAGVWVVGGSTYVTFAKNGSVATAEGGVLQRDICAELTS